MPFSVYFRPLLWLFNCTCNCYYSHGTSKKNFRERKGLRLHGEHVRTLQASSSFWKHIIVLVDLCLLIFLVAVSSLRNHFHCSLFLFIVLHMLMYAADIYFWKRYRVNYPFIFNFKQGTEQGYREVFLLGAVLAVLSLSSFLANFEMLIGLTTENDHSPAKFIPLIVLLVRM